MYFFLTLVRDTHFRAVRMQIIWKNKVSSIICSPKTNTSATHNGTRNQFGEKEPGGGEIQKGEIILQIMY